MRDLDELWCRAAEVEAEVVAFEAAQLLACLLPHSRVGTKLPAQLSQNPTLILALARLTGQVRVQSFLTRVRAASMSPSVRGTALAPAASRRALTA